MTKLFGNIKMTWLKVILFALATGIYAGLVMLLPFLKNTSFQDIGISYECWVVFAVIVVVNCNKSWEAMLKCFVFFLISQPLVYAVEVVAGALTFEQGFYYYRSIWLPATFLTLPGGLIAYFCKKQNVLGSIILGIGNAMQLILCVMYSINTVTEFPYHLLSALFCIASAALMLFGIQKERKLRIVSASVSVGLVAVVIILVKLTGRFLVSGIF